MALNFLGWSMRRDVFALFALFSCAALHAIPKTELPGEGGTVVDNSTIVNTATGRNTAEAGSTVNRGIEARNAAIVDSTITNNTSGNVNATGSRVDTGVKLDGAVVRSSNLSANTNVNINAVNSNVTAGAIQLGGAEGANVTTNVNAAINAKNSTVNVGSVKGVANGVDVNTNVGASVDAKNKVVNIGNVNLGGGGPASFDERHSTPAGGRKGETSIGNVTVESDRVKEVDVTVGGGAGTTGGKIKTRNMANTYKDNDGVDPSGTKNVYVGRKEAAEAERKAQRGGTGSAGDTYIGNSEEDRKIRKVNTFIEK